MGFKRGNLTLNTSKSPFPTISMKKKPSEIDFLIQENKGLTLERDKLLELKAHHIEELNKIGVKYIHLQEEVKRLESELEFCKIQNETLSSWLKDLENNLDGYIQKKFLWFIYYVSK